ncbi:gamma-glutamyltransferase family protein [Mesorhizobium australicum]|uniref:Gamma-glutamyltransferase 2. Threonine peptidase. MEROPS family T03 n=1 Tax=Mesorhizobium australicum TaxID=536018 RepID=A0A1X7Q138_9HYPH|nr:gamma-glutamyltransferase family protein [Mesorhizobium australicum]SMH57698.1 gamma-glutamyltransferase 2. Threonine peptidase. MEROPS family T03 [Mesorhizobium australicum]
MRDFQRPGRSPVIAGNGMAATSHPLATAAAIDVLKSGGNAVDAAVAASAVLTVVEPHMTGIGGDCFVILVEPDGSVHGLNGSGRAPAGASAEAYRARGLTDIPEYGPLSITVPGAIKAWETLLARFGTRGFDALFADAIRYAEEGYPVHARVAWDWARQVDALSADEGGSIHYLVDGRSPAAGARHRQPALGATLRAIAAKGSRAFYEGPIAAEMAAVVQAQGGYLAEEDLAAVAADWVTPISTRYRGYDVLEIPPNGQGITALIMLNLMRELGVEHLPPDSAERYHLEIEAGRIAYSVLHREVSDPATMKVAVETVLADGFTRQLARQFDPARRNPAVAFPKNPSSDTVYLSVVDRDRRAVSFINSTYDAFGSRVVTPVSGIALQNRGACFNLIEGHPNEIGPRKRPLHTIIPAMAMKDGRAFASFGVMGGDFQPMGHAHVFSNLVDHGMDPQAAIDHPRLFWGEDGVLDAEAGISPTVREGMRARGHQLRDAARPHGGGQMIVIDEENGFLVGGSDPRKDGCAMGW